MKTLSIALMCFTSLPLLIYPFVLLANVMSMAALSSPTSVSFGLSVAFFGFLIGSTLYPLPYLTSLVFSILNLKNGKPRAAFLWQSGLVGYLILVGLFFIAWLMLGDA